jgi:hypothetical protein
MKNQASHDNTKARWEKLADFTALCAWIITSTTMAVIAFSSYGVDFRGYYAAARVLLHGGNPYDYSLVASVLLDVTGRAGNNPFYYPLWFGWFVTPLTWMPFEMARAVWMIFNWVIWIVGLVRLQQLLNWPRTGWRNWLMNLLATFIFAWTTWKFEQTGILLFAITVETLIAFRKQQWNRMGLYLALALIKPNIMLLPVVALGAWLIRNKNLRPVMVMLAILTGLLIITTLLTPDWYQPILQPNFGRGLTETLDGPDQVTGVRLNTTLLDWLKLFLVTRGLRNVIYATIVIVGLSILIVTVWKSKSMMQTAAMSLLVTFAITPYALQYDYPPLAIILFWGAALSNHAKSNTIPSVIILFIASVLIWERPISDGFWIVLGLCALLIWNWKMIRAKDFPPNLS